MIYNYCFESIGVYFRKSISHYSLYVSILNQSHDCHMMYPILQRAGVRPDGRSIHGARKITLNLGMICPWMQ